MEPITNEKLKSFAQKYKKELLENVVPFWSNHSVDWKHGAYFSCLDPKGNVYDTDKFVWLQARQMWLYAMLYEKVEQNPDFLKIAENGAQFLKKYGHNGNYDWYFSLTREGKPLVQPYNIFSNTFAAMAFGRLGLLSGNKEYQQIAISTFDRILARANNPKGKYNKAYPNTRNLKGFALPMILCNLSVEITPLLPDETVIKLQEDVIDQVMNQFYNADKKIILENINQDNTFSDTYEGRLINPGHAIEAMWFIMDLAEKRKDHQMIQKAVQITLDTLEYGWDKEHGGIFYFMDILGKPQQQLEWDQKLWWVHLETLISLIKGYYLTGNEDCLWWFEKVHQYTWEHFRDAKNGGEWFGYLNRQGEVLLQLKGGKWKGCFHVPRGLFQCWQTLEKIIEKTNK